MEHAVNAKRVPHVRVVMTSFCIALWCVFVSLSVFGISDVHADAIPNQCNAVTSQPSQELEKYIENQRKTNHLAGLATGIVRGDKLIWARGFGWSDISKKRAVGPKTMFLLASLSKPVLAILVMQLLEQGKLSLDDPVNQYLPFVVEHPTARRTPITIRMLMTHTSSIIDNNPFPDVAYSEGDSPVSLHHIMKEYLVRGGKYHHQANYSKTSPGTTFEYSNIGVALLGYTIERITGESFDQYCSRALFRPLNMKNTSWKLAGLNNAHVAVPYEFRTDNQLHPNGHYGFPDYPNGQLRSSVWDLARLLVIMMNNGKYSGKKFLKPSSVKEMQRVQKPNIDPQQALIWYYSNFYGTKTLGHDGGELGASTKMFFDPAKKVGVIVLCNTSAASARWQRRQDNCIDAIASRLFSEADKLPIPKTNVMPK